MKPIKDESFNIIDTFLIIEPIVPLYEGAGWEVLVEVDNGVRSVVDLWLWGPLYPLYSKIERMHEL